MAKQDILHELSTALTVRAERIRSRIADERRTGDCNDEGEDDNDENDHPLSLPANSQVPSSQIPVSKARMKRRVERSRPQTKENIMSSAKGGRSVNIKNYRPGYTWNRGGRLKELRVRCLARKFLFLWQKKTFGSVLLSAAEQHYEVQLLHKTFGAWHDYWWEIVKEWRLGVRAECHNRYKLWYRSFMAWKQYIGLRKIKAKEKDKASAHNNKTVLAVTWRQWRASIRDRQNLALVVDRIGKSRNKRLLRDAWSVWKDRHSVALSRQENMAMALQFWTYRIQAQHLLIWRRAFLERERQRDQLLEAAVYHNSVIVSGCLKAWRIYVGNRQAKKSHTAFAGRMYHANLRVKYFNHWYYAWRLRRSLMQHQMKITELSQTFRKRWVLWRWTNYLVACQELKNKEAIADEHCNHQLMRVGLDSFRLNVVHSHIKVMRNKLAIQLRNKQVQEQVWRQWQRALEGKEESRLASHTSLARDHYRTTLLQKCVLAFQVYTAWRQQRKDQYIQAEAHYYLRTIPRCLFHMRVFVHQEKKCRHIALQAQEFYRACVLDRVFHKWQTSAQQSRDHRMMERMAILHRESVLCQSAFALWRMRARTLTLEADQMVAAREHFLQTVRAKAWRHWLEYIAGKRHRANDHIRAVEHRHLTILRGYLHKWRNQFQAQRSFKAQWKKAADHDKKKVMKTCVTEWKVLVQQGRKFKSLANEKFGHHQRRVLSLAFEEWQRVSKEQARMRRKEIAACVHHNRVLLKHILEVWHVHTSMRLYKQNETQRVLQAAADQLQQLKLSLYFKHWLRERDVALREKEQAQRAHSHFADCLLRKSLFAWRIHSRLCLRKKLLQRQCQWFHQVRVSAKCWFVWKARVREHQEETTHTQVALWYWSCGLQAKVLQGWKQYAKQRKHKKSRYVQAATVWRDHLLHQACGQWLATADSLSSVRSTMAARHHANSVFTSYHVIQRCVWHWKAWARRRAAHRGISDKRSATLALSSTVRLTTKVSEHPTLFQTYPSTDQRLHVSRPRPTASTSPVKPPPGRPAGLEKRERPKRPSFLVDSLKRAGLYSDVLFGESDPTEGQDSSTPSLTDLRGHDPDDPGTGRFIPQARPPIHRRTEADWSLSAEILSGSESTLGPGDGVVKPLILSNSDTDPSGIRTGSTSTSSHSPHMFTPSTQRSQFSGNPLLYSSPVSEKNTGRLDSRSRVRTVTAVQDFHSGSGESTDLKSNLFGTSVVNTQVVRGNLERGGFKPLHNGEILTSDVHFSNQVDSGDVEKTNEARVTLLKPEDFMKRPPPLPTSSADSGEGRYRVAKRTPRTYALRGLDQDDSGGRGSYIDSFSNQDTNRESTTNLHRHTPRDVFSPRRAVPPGILQHKVSDSDGDASPLNTARSRGTVTFASPKSPSPEEELVNIRDRLRHFRQQKDRLKSLRLQYRQLCDWLQDQKGQGQEEDISNAEEELRMLELELEELQGEVDTQRPVCERLVHRAHTLAQELQAQLAL